MSIRREAYQDSPGCCNCTRARQTAEEFSVSAMVGWKGNNSTTYRELVRPDIKGLPPVEIVLDLVFVLLKPLLYDRLTGDTNNIDDVHCAAVSPRQMTFQIMAIGAYCDWKPRARGTHGMAGDPGQLSCHLLCQLAAHQASTSSKLWRRRGVHRWRGFRGFGRPILHRKDLSVLVGRWQRLSPAQDSLRWRHRQSLHCST